MGIVVIGIYDNNTVVTLNAVPHATGQSSLYPVLFHRLVRGGMRRKRLSDLQGNNGCGQNSYANFTTTPPVSATWAKTYGGTGDDYADSIQQTSDGGYIVAGRTESYGAGNSDFWILKLETDGTVDWQKTYGGTGNDYPDSIQQTSDGGYIVAG